MQLIQLIWFPFLFLVTFTGDRMLGWCLFQIAHVRMQSSQRQSFQIGMLIGNTILTLEADLSQYLNLFSGKLPLWLLRFLILTVVIFTRKTGLLWWRYCRLLAWAHTLTHTLTKPVDQQTQLVAGLIFCWSL